MALINNDGIYVTVGSISYNKSNVLMISKSDGDIVNVLFSSAQSVSFSLKEFGEDNGFNTVDELYNHLKTIFTSESVGTGGTGGTGIIKSNNTVKNIINSSSTSIKLVESSESTNEILIKNVSDNGHKLFISKVNPSTFEEIVVLSDGDIFSLKNYTGDVFGIWESVDAQTKAIIEIMKKV
ncbi:hypothetical protein BPT24_184 [Tenacibaculum phage pT24]|uniref:Uncharacterized protein n=1 Tax=Tenacibaculum phage pT24 TaxID=1880590 RepID=A0A1B4XWY1_9CAUD|nr:hypothetical protein HYP10_gp184 [Tenacibaculum phage pT24]BAV39309.1 hypothetical protein BPT24_184 [Tenacibaculum phage pT24]